MPNRRPTAPIRISNNIPVFGWLFATCFLATTTAFDWLIVRDGWPRDLPVWSHAPIAGALVFSALVVAIWAFGLPRTRVHIGSDRVLVLERRWLFRSREDRIRHDRIQSVQTFEDRDSEGDPYFHCRIWLRDGSHVDISEGSRREDVAATAASVRAALGLD